MNRTKDVPKGAKPNDFFVWTLVTSPLIDWLFNVCLGLNDDELTTYDAARMDWVIDTPEEFRRGLIQGLAESDESVSISSQTVELWIGPNWDLARKLLLTFGVRTRRSREALSLSKLEVVKAMNIPIFSALLNTARYQRFVKLGRARRIPRGKRLPQAVREGIMSMKREGLRISEIAERVIDEFGIAVSFEAIQRWVRKAGESQEEEK
jgi:hypothetical protein